MKTIYPSILSTVAAWALRLALLVAGMALAVQLFAQTNCAVTVTSSFEDPTVNCQDPIPAFAPFEATSSCCEGPVNLTYFTSQGYQFVENCTVSTAFGPGPDWSVWLPNLPGGLSQYWHFIGNPSWQAFNDGTAHLTGVVAMQGNTTNQFAVDMWFQNGKNWSDWNALGRGYKDDLQLGLNHYENWMYYELAPNFANLTGLGNLAGSHLSLSHQPSTYYYGFQSGIAANNRNANSGLSGWFYYNGVVNGLVANGHGDVNVDSSCETGVGCANTVHTLVARAEDACGNVAYGQQSIQIVDNTAPVVDAYEEIIQLDCENSDGIFITATDNCSEILITYSDASEGACSPITRTYTIADACGNTTTAVQTILRNAGVPPQFTVFPEPITLECDAADEIPTPEVLWSVGCGGEELTISSETFAGDCPNTYTTIYTYIVEDNCGGADTALWVVDVVDTTAPELFNVPEDMEIECGDEIPEVNVFALDNCDLEVVTSLSAETVYGTCGYDFIRTWSATDACGNTTTATQVIHVNDTEKPNFSFVPSSVFLECGTPFELAIPTANDECSVVEMEWTDVDLEDCAGSYARIFRAFDGCGNSRLATVFVMFSDTEAPEMIEFPDDVFVTCSTIPSQSEVNVAWQDNCGNVTAEVSQTTVDGDCPGAYTIVRTWELTDDCGNTSSYDWNIHVSDEQAPELIGVPADMTIGCGDEIVEAVVVADDDCAQDILVTLNAETIQNACGYIFERTWTATDGCGNTSTATQAITVEDNEAPYFTYVPADINLACSTGDPGPDNGDLAIAADDCSNVTVTFFDSVIEGNCGNGVLRTFVATDGCGNTATAEQIISFSDNFSPVFTFVSEDIAADCGDEIVIAAPVAEDACSEVVISFVDVLINSCGGSFQRVYTATDACGNTTTATVDVIYNDGATPQITNGPADIAVACDQIPSIESAQLVFTDNCGNVSFDQEEVRIDGDCPGNYQLVRTYTLTDDCGNASQWVWTIAVSDIEGPQIIGVPADIALGCGDEIPAADVFALDQCDPAPTLDINAVTVENLCGYDFVRTWTATDHCGNTTTIEQVVTVTDDVDPVFTYVPADVNFSCGELGDIEMATADDACSFVEVTFNDEILNATSGSFIRHWVATDGCGNTATAETMVTFNLDGPPAILCPGNQELNAGINCSPELPDYRNLVWVESTCIDPTTVVVSQSPISGTLITSNTVVTMTVETAEGASASCSFNVILVDNTPPSLLCPVNQTIALNPNCAAALPNYTALALAQDACTDVVEIVQTPSPGTLVSGLSEVTVVLIATDAAGNTTECSFGVQPVDTNPPFFTQFPDDVVVECDQIPGAESAQVQYMDVCGNATITMTELVLTDGQECASSYTIQRSYTITDDSNNSFTQVWTIQVEDNTPPQLFGVPLDAVVQCGDPISEVDVTATDNCDFNVTVSLTANTIQLDCGYIFQRVWTAEDDCGNTATAVQNITVQDAVEPYFTFVPASTVISCENYGTALNDLPTAIAMDDCSIVTVTHADQMNVDCSGGFTRTWTATDGCGNTTTAQTTYTVEDIDAPVFVSVPMNLTVPACSELPEATIDQIIFTENCSTVTLTVVDESVELDCPNSQLVYRMWRLTDACGNQASYTQEIYVIDEVGPTLVGVPANQTLNCGEEPEEANVTAFDDCGNPEDVTVSLHAKTTQLSCGKIFVRVWTATDACGNSTIATQEITYIDEVAPVFEYVPAEVFVDCGSEFILEEPVITDDCSTFTWSVTDTPVDCSGSFERLFTATDGCGNSAQALQLVIINDFNPPMPNWIPNDLVVTDCNALPAIDENYVTFTDNCSEVNVVFYSDTNYFCGTSFNIVYGWAVTDACGNFDSITMNVTFNDVTPPQFDTVPADITLNCGDEIPEAIISATDACGIAYIESNDNLIDLACGYQIERTWYAFDDCGNIAEYLQRITFEDNQDPQFTATPANLTLSCSDIIPTPALVLGVDDCQGLIAAEMIGEQIVSGSCNSNYTILRTYQLVDECGNTNEYVQTIEVADTQAPEFFNFASQIEVVCTQSNGVFATAFDECSSIAVSYSDELIGSGCSGQILRTYTATDACGNSNTALQTIALLDTTSPVFTAFPDDVTADCGSIPNPESAVIGYTDNCSNPSIAMVETSTPGSCANEYLLFRTYTLTDACGNSAEQTWTITVQDNSAPEIFGVPADAVIECGEAVPSINPIALDGCDENPTLSVTAVTLPAETGCGSIFIRSWVAEDACGNSTTISHRTDIVDTTAPVLSQTPSDVTISCAGTVPPAAVITATDACDGAVDVEFTETGGNNPCDPIVRQWCATDCAGNVTCHTQTIFRGTTPVPGAGPQLQAVNTDRHQVLVNVLASSAGRWNLDVYDVAGRKVTNLLTQNMDEGQTHTFVLDCNGFTDTIYLFRWFNGTEQVTQKVVMMK